MSLPDIILVTSIDRPEWVVREHGMRHADGHTIDLVRLVGWDAKGRPLCVREQAFGGASESYLIGHLLMLEFTNSRVVHWGLTQAQGRGALRALAAKLGLNR